MLRLLWLLLLLLLLLRLRGRLPTEHAVQAGQQLRVDGKAVVMEKRTEVSRDILKKRPDTKNGKAHLMTSLGPTTRHLVVRPLKSAKGPSLLNNSRRTTKPRTSPLPPEREARCTRALMTSAGEEMVRDQTAPVVEATMS